MFSSTVLCSALVVVPLMCVMVSFIFPSYSENFVDYYFEATLIKSTYYALLCSLPFKDIAIASNNCDTQSYQEKSTISNSKSLDPYSEVDTFMLGMLKNENDQMAKDAGTRKHGFNLFASDNIGLWREIPDTRNTICKDKVYKNNLPTTSVVMCFYNEAWSTLLRSIHSIISGTPKEMIKEIVLIDDNSSNDYLKSPLDEYIKANFSNVKIYHSPFRLGLIRARMEGAKRATGEVLVFLDSHIEVGQDWLPPLLDRIAKDRKTVVVPVVDTIEGETMIYKKANFVRGGFTWSLLHNWEQLPLDVLKQVEIKAEPFISPTMPGGLFAMERDYFYELGEYDGGMNIWGGENMEISFRIWMCGGRLEIVPCSRIGHVFRQFRPYSSPNGDDTVTRNAARVAHVWLDEYKKHFFDLRPTARTMDYGDVSDRVALRKKLGCKSFGWFLENIHPEQIVPGEEAKTPGAYFRRIQRPPPKVVAEGFLKHERSSLCVVPDKDPPTKGTTLSLEKCHLVKNKSERFVLGDNYSLKLSENNLCLETRVKKQAEVYLMKCAPGGFQTWLQITMDGHQVLYNPPSGMCLAVTKPQANNQLILDICSRPSTRSFVVK